MLRNAELNVMTKKHIMQAVLVFMIMDDHYCLGKHVHI